MYNVCIKELILYFNEALFYLEYARPLCERSTNLKMLLVFTALECLGRLEWVLPMVHLGHLRIAAAVRKALSDLNSTLGAMVYSVAEENDGFEEIFIKRWHSTSRNIHVQINLQETQIEEGRWSIFERIDRAGSMTIFLDSVEKECPVCAEPYLSNGVNLSLSSKCKHLFCLTCLEKWKIDTQMRKYN